jgi:DNA repair photolyase
MYKINADFVYVIDRVYENECSRIRLERMLNSMKPKNVKKITYQELNDIVQKENKDKISHDARTGFHLSDNKRIFVFDNFIWNEDERNQLLKKYPELEYLGFLPFRQRNQWNHEFCVCQSAWEMHSLDGCLHTCAYCHINKFFHIMLNLEELLKHLRELMDKIPSQQLYKYDNRSDQITLEPEYGASELFVPFFGSLNLEPKKYLLLYTKSDNIDHLLNMKHNKRVIINWTLSPETESIKIEKGAPSMSNRLLAIKKCYEAGYIVRVRFSPMIPVKNWKEEYAEMIKRLFEYCKPDVISLDILGFMSPKGALNSIDPQLFDEKALKILKSLLKVEKTWQKHLFPHEYRAEIYTFIYNEIRKYDQNIPVALCNETFDMWEEFEDKWIPKMNVEDYVCCCGPTSVPGNKWLQN